MYSDPPRSHATFLYNNYSNIQCIIYKFFEVCKLSVAPYMLIYYI